MRKLKIIIIVYLSIVIYYNHLYAQVNTIKIGKKNLGALVIAKGAHVNSKDEWTIKQNNISKEKSSTNTIDNFISYQIRPSSFNNKSSFIFIKKYIENEISIGDYNNSFSVSFLIFDSLQFISFKPNLSDTICLLKVKKIHQGKIEKLNFDSTYISNIENYIKDDNSKSDYAWDTLMFFRPYKNTNQIQFMLHANFKKNTLQTFDSSFYFSSIVEFKKLLNFNPNFSNFMSLNPSEDMVEIYTITEEMPEFPGGSIAFLDFLKSNYHHPTEAAYRRLEGKCVLQFIIGETGSISDIKILEELNGYPECSKELLRVLYIMPKFKPAKQNGIAVPVYRKVTFNYGEMRRW